MKKTQLRRGFTMVELLLVIALLAIVGAIALPSFLDLQNEAKAAAVRGTLGSLRAGLANQRQQVVLRCGYTPRNNIIDFNALYYNDITSALAVTYARCTTAQIPNAPDRKVFTFEGKRVGGTFATNPFVKDVLFDLIVTSQAAVDLAGGPCGLSTQFRSILGSDGVEWFYNADSGEIFAGSNTAGFQECSL